METVDSGGSIDYFGFTMRMTFLVLVAVVCASPTGASAQVKSESAAVVEKVEQDPNGTLHIVYSDRSRITPPRERTWGQERGSRSYSDAAVASDKQTVGWLVNYQNCCTSYDIPLTLMIFRSGKVIRRVGDGMMIADWYFLAGGKEVVYHAGTVHGDDAGHSARVDIATGKVLATYHGTPDERSPDWTRRPK
jgi:hypothetical protein